MSIPTDAMLNDLAAGLGRRLTGRGMRLATAESCTGGWIAKVITDIAGSSNWFEAGLLTYSNSAKRRVLGVSERTLAEHGAVSEAVVLAMATGALAAVDAGIAVSVSGIAGPGGAVAGKPVGTVWFGFAQVAPGDIRTRAAVCQFDGDREAVRRRSVGFALESLLALELP